MREARVGKFSFATENELAQASQAGDEREALIGHLGEVGAEPLQVFECGERRQPILTYGGLEKQRSQPRNPCGQASDRVAQWHLLAAFLPRDAGLIVPVARQRVGPNRQVLQAGHAGKRFEIGRRKIRNLEVQILERAEPGEVGNSGGRQPTVQDEAAERIRLAQPGQIGSVKRRTAVRSKVPQTFHASQMSEADVGGGRAVNFQLLDIFQPDKFGQVIVADSLSRLVSDRPKYH